MIFLVSDSAWAMTHQYDFSLQNWAQLGDLKYPWHFVHNCILCYVATCQLLVVGADRGIRKIEMHGRMCRQLCQPILSSYCAVVAMAKLKWYHSQWSVMSLSAKGQNFESLQCVSRHWHTQIQGHAHKSSGTLGPRRREFEIRIL